MNPARFDVGSTEPRKEKDSRRFWIVTITVAVLLAAIALVYLLTH